jgi:eukaryotic-like serine/threonine-protein kinase
MSPEQACGQEVDERSDIYSICVMFHEFLCLEHYLADRTTTPAVIAGVREVKPRAPSFLSNPHQPTVPMDLTWYVKAGLDKDRDRRFSSVSEMIQRLRDRAEGKIPIQCHVTFTKRMTREWLRLVDRWPLVVPTVAFLGLAALVVEIVRLAAR